MRVGEAEVSSQRAHLTDADVGDVAFHARQGRQTLGDYCRALKLAVRGGRTDHERAVLPARRVTPRCP